MFSEPIIIEEDHCCVLKTIKKEIIKGILAYIGTIVLCIIILVWVMQLWKADLSIPFSYCGDSLSTSVGIKGIIDNGWNLQNKFIGMPFGPTMYDFPSADNFHWLLIKIISIFIPNYSVVFNLYYLLTFPLTALCSLYVFRRFNLSYAISIIGSLIFTFIPYHFIRLVGKDESHLLLAAYYMIPPIVMVILWVYKRDDMFFNYDINKQKLVFGFLNKKAISALLICILISSSGIYYAFFACFFLAVAGISSFLWGKKVHYLITSVILIAVISAGVLINISPTLSYNHKYGKNNQFIRNPLASEYYGMKISQLILPVTDHRIPYLASLKDKYNKAPLINENESSSLGVVGSVGFLVLLANFIYGKRFRTGLELESLSELNIAAVLLATIGGFGTIYAILVSPQIRSYNRISIYIAFFSVFTVLFLLQKFSNRYIKNKTTTLVFYVFLGILLCIAILDQTTSKYVSPYKLIKSDFTNDQIFVDEIENLLPQNAMVFQLPRMSFPENGSLYKMESYDLFRGYLHSKNLRWSFGSMKGRWGDLWQSLVTSKPLIELVETVSLAGFSGIYIDSYGYLDNGKAIIAELTNILHIEPIISNNHRLYFFNLAQFNQKLRNKYTESELVSKQEFVLNPLIPFWRGGFSDLEGSSEENWRWCSTKGELHLFNTSKLERVVNLEMMFASGDEDYSNLTISSSLFASNINMKINSNGKLFKRVIRIPSGEYVINFVCDTKRVNVPDDLQFLVFKVMNYKQLDIK